DPPDRQPHPDVEDAGRLPPRPADARRAYRRGAARSPGPGRRRDRQAPGCRHRLSADAPFRPAPTAAAAVGAETSRRELPGHGALAPRRTASNRRNSAIPPPPAARAVILWAL